MTRLKNILRFVGLVDGIPASLPHQLNWNGRAVIPDFVDSSIGGFVITADATNVTITRQPGSPASADVLVESWHSIERAFGAKQTLSLVPQPFISAGGNGSGGGFAPARTLFVAQSWPAGVDPSVYFTKISDAEVFAATMVPFPTRADPVTIIIYPGTYADDLTLVSNVHLNCHTRRDVVVTGNVVWTPGAGVNASLVGGEEQADIAAIRFEGTISIDSTAKTGASNSAFDGRGIDVRNTVTMIGRGGGARTDHFQLWLSTLICTVNFTNVIVNLSSGTYLDLNFAGECDFDVNGDQVFGVVTLAGTSVGALQATQIFGNVNVGTGTSIDIVSSVLEQNAVLTVAAGGDADIRMSEFQVNAQLVGPGPIDRSIWTTTIAGTAAGNNVIPISPPYPDGLYNVAIELTAAGAYPPVSAKGGSSFTINDPVGGNTYNFTLMKAITSVPDHGVTPPLP